MHTHHKSANALAHSGTDGVADTGAHCVTHSGAQCITYSVSDPGTNATSMSRRLTRL